jgi:23S rRNA (cytosine1962-C5)-methyltransferase
MVPTVVVSSRGADRILSGHPWVYRSDIVKAEAEPGDLVRVAGEGRRKFGWALWSSTSQIAIRMIESPGSPKSPQSPKSPEMLEGRASARPETFDERALFRARLKAAIDYRASLEMDATACRLVNGEADRLPALVVDRYGDVTGDYLVVQTLCQGMDRRKDLIIELLTELAAPRGILARNDPKVRLLEGLEQQVEVWAGEVPDRIAVREGAVRLQVDVRHGQKTGLFLDQRENHQAAARLTRGRVLDAFSYHGGFALPMAARTDERVLALDSSDAAVAATRAQAAANDLANVEVREVNVFDELRGLDRLHERFDTIVLDPPAFAKTKSAVAKASAGYKEINLRALKLLNPGGTLVTCSCSYHVSEAMFAQIVYEAAVDARAVVTVVEKRMQGRDHPVLLGVPETYYLKCFILRKGG